MARSFITLMIFFPALPSLIDERNFFLWRELRKVLRTSSFNKPTLGLSISFYSKKKPLEFMTNCLFRSPASQLWILLHNRNQVHAVMTLRVLQVIVNFFFVWRWENLKKIFCLNINCHFISESDFKRVENISIIYSWFCERRIITPFSIH